ncbi:hypothetical protein SPHINGO8BC_90343 [Sphingobacterium multivorum]|uniref:Uncharacterized protein n=1 Tax=Sphingobacterium multivorum TaxID=28454 RepID=A0A654DRT8_SPHMU|nr:hypothetical protein SPHINGO8BC_90343 [Sphingobacterium multivorum]
MTRIWLSLLKNFTVKQDYFNDASIKKAVIARCSAIVGFIVFPIGGLKPEHWFC